MTEDKSSLYQFNWLYGRRFFRLHGVLFPGLLSANSLVFWLLLLVAIGEQFLAYQVGLVSGQFYKVLGDKDWPAFRTATLQATATILLMAVVLSFKTFLTRVLTVGWRRCLTLALHRLYFANIRYYQLNVLDQGHTLDNPDQRITSDINTLCTQYGSVIADILISPFTIAYYTYSAYIRAGWIGPSGMFAFFFVSTIANKLLMNPIVGLTVEQEQREGDFRFKHVSVRVHSEPLAFHGSARVESDKADNRLQTLCATQQRVYNRQFVLDFAVNSFAYLGSIASFLVISVPIFAGAYDHLQPTDLAQLISENAFVCIYLVSQFTKLVNMSATLSSMAGVTHRVGELVETLARMRHKYGVIKNDDEEEDDDDSDEAALSSVSSDGDSDPPTPVKQPEGVVLSVRKVTVRPPNSKVNLISDLTIDFKLGVNVLIMGRSSAGKSSLLRVLRGLWPIERHGGGTIAEGNLDGGGANQHKIFFLPQRPFFTDGTLREQIVYPLQVVSGVVSPTEDDWIRQMLEMVSLSDLIGRCGGSLDASPSWAWYDALSPGEMQRLAFIRLFYHRPTLAFLDEATSALSQDIEEKLYEKCIELGLTLVSVGHRASLKHFHQRLLRLGLPGGAWEVEDIAAE